MTMLDSSTTSFLTNVKVSDTERILLYHPDTGVKAWTQTQVALLKESCVTSKLEATEIKKLTLNAPFYLEE